jgi:CheY-like chemotaxis protein
MPGMNGPDTIDALRKSSAHNLAPVIFVTEQKKIAMIEEYKALGVLGVIYKPFDPASFKEHVYALWQTRPVLCVSG